MECLRCGKVIDTSIQERNADCYGSNIYACPKCGKPYKFVRVVTIKIKELSSDVQLEEDDWGHKIVNDNDFSLKR